jgi:hypothetical protein
MTATGIGKLHRVRKNSNAWPYIALTSVLSHLMRE